jgi:hypothetical protein
MSITDEYLEHFFPKLPNSYLSRGIESVLELYGQRTYMSVFACVCARVCVCMRMCVIIFVSSQDVKTLR